MLEKKEKLIKVGELIPYPKRENGVIVKDPVTGEDMVGGVRRQVIFESLDFRKDTILITLFNDEATGFSCAIGSEGKLQIVIETHEISGVQDTEQRYFSDIRLINFNPVD